MTPSHSRAAAALGALTALAGALLLLGVGPLAGAPVPLSVWLVLCGLALCWLGIDAGRRERHAIDAVAALDRAESARRAADARSRELAEHAGDVLATLSPDGVVLDVSDGCRELLDLAPGALEGTRAADLVHPGDSATSVAAMTRLQRGDERAAVTVRLRRADGAWRWADAQLLAVHDVDGPNRRSTPRSATSTPAPRPSAPRPTPRRASAPPSRRRRSGWRSPRLDGRFLQVNRALCLITGREQEELEGTPLVRLLHPEDREDEGESLARLARGDRESVRAERRWLHAAGKIVWTAMSATLVRDAAGVPKHVLLQVQDVTERRRYETELHYLADHDPLTGLLNRRAFARELESHLEHVAPLRRRPAPR